MNKKEYLVDLEEKFQKVVKLLENSVHDPETTPHYSKNAARQHLQAMDDIICTTTKQNNEDMSNKLIGMHGVVQLQLGIIATDTEELYLSEEHFKKCLEIIENHTKTVEVASVALNLYNNLGILWARQEADKGLKCLNEAEEFYISIKDAGIVPIDYLDLFSTNYEVEDSVAMAKFEKAFTLTLYYLAQVHGCKNSLKSAVYCHRTLQRQLDSHDYDSIDWALNTATLSQYLMEKNGFKQARHHLCASLYMLEEHKRNLDADRCSGDEFEAKLEKFRNRSADVARCWIKYCINLVTASKERLINTEDVDVIKSVCTDLSRMDLQDQCDVSKEDLENLEFRGIDLTSFETIVGDQYILTIEDAKNVMKCAQKYVATAQDYYSLNTLASDYIEIAQDHAQMYTVISFFEEDPDIRSKFLKRAIDILEKVQEEINPTYYLRYCQQIWSRLGTLYSDLLDIKLDRLKGSTQRPVQHSITKINTLAAKAIMHFEKFVNSYRNPSGVLPPRVPEDDEKLFLQALFHIAAIQMRHISLDKNVQLANTEKSLKHYNDIMDYCRRNDKAEECVQAEIAIVRELLTLLPLKIARIRNELPVPLNK